MPMTMVDQMLVNDLNRVSRAIDARKRALDAILKKADKPKRVTPHRYVMDLPVVPQANADSPQFQPVTRSFVVDKQSKGFLVEEIVATPAVIGTLPDGSAAKVSLPPFNNAFSYQWQVQDSYTDRAWQNDWLPDLMLCGKLGGLRVKRVCLPPGTLVTFTMMPMTTNAAFLGSVVTGATEYSLQVSFVGAEVL